MLTDKKANHIDVDRTRCEVDCFGQRWSAKTARIKAIYSARFLGNVHLISFFRHQDARNQNAWRQARQLRCRQLDRFLSGHEIFGGFSQRDAANAIGVNGNKGSRRTLGRSPNAIIKRTDSRAVWCDLLCIVELYFDERATQLGFRNLGVDRCPVGPVALCAEST